MTKSTLNEADALFIQSITDSLKSVPFEDLDEPIFHFTDRQSVESILRTRSLRVSLATALKGQSEINYVLARARDLIQSGRIADDRSLLKEIVPLLDSDASPTINMLGMKTFVLSFRTGPHEREHWDRYGKCGTGMALAFAMKPLVIEGVLPNQVLYYPSTQDRILRHFIEKSLFLFDKLARDCPARDMKALRLRAGHYSALGIWTLAPTMKPSQFESEKERRLIVVDCNDDVGMTYGTGISREVFVRRAKGQDVPFKVLEYGSLPVVGLELGPNATCELDDTGLKQLLLDATGRRGVPVTRSSVLYPDRAG